MTDADTNDNDVSMLDEPSNISNNDKHARLSAWAIALTVCAAIAAVALVAALVFVLIKARAARRHCAAQQSYNAMPAATNSDA